MTVYDDPINAARRLLTIHKDQPWAQKELVELMPLVLDAYDKLEDRYDEGYAADVSEFDKREQALLEEMDDLEADVNELTREIIELIGYRG